MKTYPKSLSQQGIENHEASLAAMSLASTPGQELADHELSRTAVWAKHQRIERWEDLGGKIADRYGRTRFL